MALVIETCAYAERVTIIPDPDAVAFVAKIQKAKTRKNKDYFVLRTTVPKEIAEKIGAEAGDYLFFKTKKAQWYHMLDWKAMENTWQMLPTEVKNKVIVDGLYNQRVLSQANSMGAANLSAPLPQLSNMQANQPGEIQWK